MAAEERLRLTVRKRRNGQKVADREVRADWKDHDLLHQYLVDIVTGEERVHEGRVHEYDLHVTGVDKAWIATTIAGRRL